MKHLKKFNELNEGVTMKASKSKDSDVKKESFREKIQEFVKSKGYKTKKVGDDFEIHIDGVHLVQVMFRDEYICVKKVDNKFPKKFKYNQLGDVKKEISNIIK